MRTFLRLSLMWAVLLAPLAVFSQEPPNNATTDGSAIYGQRCVQCHGANGEGVNAYISFAGPPLQAVHDRQYVMDMVRHGQGVMPTFGNVLSEQQIQAVADYVTQHIAVIPLTGGNLTDGGELFRVNCAPCHRTAVRGGALAYTGTNAPALTGMTPSTIAGAIRFGPGPMPAFPASAIDDKQLASIVSYVQFVQHPPSPGGNTLNWYGPVAEGLIAWIATFVLVGLAMWIEKGGKG